MGNLSLEVCEQVGFEPASLATSLGILGIESLGVVLSIEQKTKTLIRLCGCTG